MTPPKPPARAARVSFWQHLRLFRQDILSSQPAHLFGAKMAEFRTPFFRSYLVNEPALIRTVLNTRPEDFPKSDRVAEGLRPLLGQSIFVTNGEIWARQRRIIDPAFEGGRTKDSFPAILAAADGAAARLKPGAHEVEALCAHAAADVIFRALFSVPIEDAVAAQVYAAFRRYQRAQPIVNLAAFIPLPRWVPRGYPRAARTAATEIRALIAEMCARRQAEIESGTAPEDLATKIMTTADPETGARFSTEEMVDQVAIFFLAGHETSASALAWALYLMALYPEWQAKVATEAQALQTCDFSVISKLTTTRDVFRETLRLYPPVPMMVRQATKAAPFRDRTAPRGSQLVISPWHLHRHERLWARPDAFAPTRWHTENGKSCQRDAFIPFSAGTRVCTGAGFAVVEGVLILARLLRDFEVESVPDRDPVPVAHLTVRARDGIWLNLRKRQR